MPVRKLPPEEITRLPPHTDDFGFRNLTATWTVFARIAGNQSTPPGCRTGGVTLNGVYPGGYMHGSPPRQCQADGVNCQGTLYDNGGNQVQMNVSWHAPPGTWICAAVFEAHDDGMGGLAYFGEFTLSNGEVHYDIPV